MGKRRKIHAQDIDAILAIPSSDEEPPVVDVPPTYTVIVEGLLRMNPTKAYRTVVVVPQPVTSRLFVYEGKDHEFVGLEKNVRVYRNQTRP